MDSCHTLEETGLEVDERLLSLGVHGSVPLIRESRRHMVSVGAD